MSLMIRRLVFGILVALILLFFAWLTYAFLAVIQTSADRINLGVFLATAGALIASVAFSFWDSYLERPELKILFDSDADHYTPQLTIFSQEQSTDGKITISQQENRFLRVRIHNAGSRTAKRCFGQLELIERSEGTHTLSKVEKTLYWAEVPQFPSIPPKAKFPLNVAYSRKGLVIPFEGGCDKNVRAWIFTKEAFMNPKIRMQDAMCLGEYKVKITIFSDNTKPKEERFVIHVPEKWDALSMTHVDC